MSKYGIPYQGSKSKIAGNIISKLPRGKRFADLFGGGFAMSHCALLSGKYNSVYYNELNPLLPKLIKKAINGDYNYNKFVPEFIDRETFFRLKEVDGYIKWIWSFGNNGRNYLFGENIEQRKKLVHNWVVFGKYDSRLNIPKNLRVLMNGKDIKTRRLQLKKIARALQTSIELEQLERLERLEQLQQLERLELNCGSYLDYKYEDGDVVYCDPPYENTVGYNKTKFNSTEFYDWVASRNYPVFFSSYKISDDRFKLIYCKLKTGLMSIHEKRQPKTECLYLKE